MRSNTKLIDKNKSWLAPEGYRLVGVRAEGAFLSYTYRKVTYYLGGACVKTESTQRIWANDIGREISREIVEREFDFPPPVLSEPVSGWRKITIAFFLALRGLQEIIHAKNGQSED